MFDVECWRKDEIRRIKVGKSKRNNKANKKQKKEQGSSKSTNTLAIITLVVTILGIIIAFITPVLQNLIIANNRDSYMKDLNNSYISATNLDANDKFQGLLEKTNREEYQDIHDYWMGMSKVKSNDLKSAKVFFEKISEDSLLFPTAIYSRMQCGLHLSNSDDERLLLLEELIGCCDKNGKSSSLECFMLKALYYRLNLNYGELKQTINDYIKTPYYEGVTLGLSENLYIEDIIAYKTIYSALLITMMYSADENQIYDDWDWILQEINKQEITNLRALKNSPYFSCACLIMEDAFLLPQSLQIANDFYNLGLGELKGELSFEYPKEYIDTEHKNYRFK